MSDTAQIVGIGFMALELLLAFKFTESNQDRQRFCLAIALILGVILF